MDRLPAVELRSGSGARFLGGRYPLVVIER